jgi:hypothetical protein
VGGGAFLMHALLMWWRFAGGKEQTIRQNKQRDIFANELFTTIKDKVVLFSTT